MAVQEREVSARHNAFTISLNGKHCGGYGYSTCVNVIGDKNGRMVFSDIQRPSSGYPASATLHLPDAEPVELR